MVFDLFLTKLFISIIIKPQITNIGLNRAKYFFCKNARKYHCGNKTKRQTMILLYMWMCYRVYFECTQHCRAVDGTVLFIKIFEARKFKILILEYFF